jgi:hypothetical protein
MGFVYRSDHVSVNTAYLAADKHLVYGYAMTTMLDDANAVIDALGGTNATAALTGRSKQQVSFWRRANVFPSRHFLVMRQALMDKGLGANSRLWGMSKLPPEKIEAAE